MSDAIKKLNGTVPKNLKQILKKSGVRQCDLAKSVGLTRQNITDIVSCRRLIHASEIEAIADALDVTPNDLFGIAPTERTGEWIPVSERLPSTSEQVLVTVLWHEPFDNHEVTLGEYWDNGEAWGDWKDGEIIAWQPLPEPYKGGDTE